MNTLPFPFCPLFAQIAIWQYEQNFATFFYTCTKCTNFRFSAHFIHFMGISLLILPIYPFITYIL